MNKSRVYKAIIYFVDFNGHYEWNDTDFWSDFERLMGNSEWSAKIFDKDQSAYFDWNDNVAINYDDATREDYEKYFKVNKMTLEEIEKQLGYKVEIVT